MFSESTLNLRRAFLACLLVTTVVFFGSPVMAQEAESDKVTDEVQDEAIQQAIERSFEGEVTVTGSLIPRADLEALSPVTTMDPEEITYSGNTRVEDLITSLPQAFAAQNSTVANGASGTATVSLRGLGSVRTLVLINGRRLAPGDASGTYAPDLNVIPSALIKRVDVLTGGASAAYGSDAVAGVVNFILDTDFEGIRGGIQYGFFNHNNNNSVAQAANEAAGFPYPSGSTNDGTGITANIAMGGKFADGKGYGSAYIDFRDLESVTKSQRDYFNCTISRGSSGPYCGGSSTTPRGRFIISGVGDYTIDLTGEGGDGHSFRPRAGEVFNYGPFNHIQRPDRKFTAGGFVGYEINEHFEGYLEVMLMDNYSDAQIAPSGNFGRTSSINCDNPMLSEQQWETVCGGPGYGLDEYAPMISYRRNIEGGPRMNQIGHTNYRFVAGMKGDINDTWSYDFYGLWAQNNQAEAYINDLNTDRLRNALDIIGDRNDPTTWECRSGSADGCVPWNIFQEGGVTQAALDYIATVAVQTGVTRTDVVNLTFTGDLEDYGWTIPWASEGIQVAGGLERRGEYLENRPDEVYATGNRAGGGGLTPRVAAGFYVEEAFLEALVPVIQDSKGFKDLSLELGYRYSDYSISGAYNTWKAQANWAINNSWRFRGGFNRAVRAPNVWELYRPQGFGLGGSEDICANDEGTGLPSATLEQCMRTGVTQAQYGTIYGNPADQYNTLAGGNPNLTPEIADTITAGIVWTPQAVRGLSVMADYYFIDITDTVGALGADDIIQTCATTGDPALCSLIHRDSLGTLWATDAAYTETTSQNIGGLQGEGVDLNAAYLLGLGNTGYINMSIVGTYLLKDRFFNPLTDYDCVGYYGNQCGQPRAEWRHRFRASWETNFNMIFTMAWRHLGETQVDDASPDSDIGNPSLMPSWEINGAASTPAYNWFDLTAVWALSNGINFRVGVNNIFDEDPPLFPSLSDTAYTGSYDPLGRWVHLGMQFNF